MTGDPPPPPRKPRWRGRTVLVGAFTVVAFVALVLGFVWLVASSAAARRAEQAAAAQARAAAADQRHERQVVETEARLCVGAVVGALMRLELEELESRRQVEGDRMRLLVDALREFDRRAEGPPAEIVDDDRLLLRGVEIVVWRRAGATELVPDARFIGGWEVFGRVSIGDREVFLHCTSRDPTVRRTEVPVTATHARDEATGERVYTLEPAPDSDAWQRADRWREEELRSIDRELGLR